MQQTPATQRRYHSPHYVAFRFVLHSAGEIIGLPDFASSCVYLILLVTVQDDCNEAVDKDIAQHLVCSNFFPLGQTVTIKQVHLHQRREDAVSPPISKEELQRCGSIRSRQAIMPNISSPAATSTTRKHGFTPGSRPKPASRCGKRRLQAFG